MFKDLLLTPKQIARYKSYVDVRSKDDCWPWRRKLDRDGYATIQFNGLFYKGHRISFYLRYGKLPLGMGCHTCNHSWCQNPLHVYDGNAKTNAMDRIKAGHQMRGQDHWSRRYPERVPRGDVHGRSKLTTSDVKEIRCLYRLGQRTQVELAQKFRVAQHTISCIVRRKIWTHV